MSLSWKDEQETTYGDYNFYGSDMKLEPTLAQNAAPTPKIATNQQPKKKPRPSKIVGVIFAIVMVCTWIYLGISGIGNYIREMEYDSQLTAQPAPASGTILSGKEYFNRSKIKITAPTAYDCVVSLRSVTGTERVAFYVRKGETVTVGVPAEFLCVYFAVGDKWYGYGDGLMFGKGTEYSKDDEAKDFVMYTWEYSLQPESDGNFSETPASEDEFFK